MFHALVFYNTWETLFCAHFGELLPQKSQNNNFIKICLMYFSVFMLLQLPAKKTPICYKTWKTHFGPLFVPKSQCKIFPRKIVLFSLKLLCCCNIPQKNQTCSINWVLIIPEKPHFEPIFEDCRPKTPKTKIFSKYVLTKY